jgi:cytochrome c553
MNASRPLLATLAFAAAILVTAPGGVRAADVAENWSKNCASCHGKDGKGETKAGKKAGVKDMTDAKYQAELSDEKAMAVIKEGLKEDGKEKMKPFAAKLSDDDIKALVAKVRSFKK